MISSSLPSSRGGLLPRMYYPQRTHPCHASMTDASFQRRYIYHDRPHTIITQCYLAMTGLHLHSFHLTITPHILPLFRHGRRSQRYPSAQHQIGTREWAGLVIHSITSLHLTHITFPPPPPVNHARQAARVFFRYIYTSSLSIISCNSFCIMSPRGVHAPVTGGGGKG